MNSIEYSRRLKVIKGWDNIGFYVWGKLEEEWPRFNTYSTESLGPKLYWGRRQIHLSPNEYDKEKIISIVTEYINSHRAVGVDELLGEGEVAKDIEWLSEFDHYVSLFWDVENDEVLFQIKPGDTFKYEPLNYLELLKKRYNFETKVIDLISSFGHITDKVEYIKKMRQPIINEFDMFVEKWQEKFNKEVTEQKEVLEKIIYDMFDQDGVLKKEVYKVEGVST